MSTPPKPYFKNTYHHLYNRGVNKQKIFFDDKDYLFFLRRLGEYKEKYKISVLSYCLMPNHYHLFVKQLTQKHKVGKFIGDLTNSYTKATNKRYNRSGVLFAGPNKSILIKNQNYFIWLVKYILMNPVEAGLVSKPEEWRYSSARDFYGFRNGKLPDKKEILSQFHSIEHFKSFIESKDDFDYGKFEIL
jgi:REP element-mobilizing transposase RayT